MAIKVKGRKVTLTGKDAKSLKKSAKLFKMTPRQLFIKALEEMLISEKST